MQYRKSVLFTANVIFILIFVFGVELILRLQQYAGPYINLDFAKYLSSEPSTLLNHVPRLEEETPRRGSRIDARKFNSIGIRDYSSLKIAQSCDVQKKIIFFGDLFMEGYDDKHTVPSILVKDFSHENICIVPFNAGFSSYSPAIFVPQARKLLPIIHPEYVVIDIDETDFFDDNFRYKNLIIRDDDGKNIGVKETPGAKDIFSELVAIQESTFFIERIFRVYSGKYAKILNSTSASQFTDPIFAISKLDAPVARERYKEELDFFKSNVDELLSVIRENKIEARKVFIVRHPHLGHLKSRLGASRWNDVVFEAVKEVAEASGVNIFDAKNDMAMISGNHPEHFYFPNDMHFNYEGLAVYSALIKNHLEKKI